MAWAAPVCWLKFTRIFMQVILLYCTTVSMGGCKSLFNDCIQQSKKLSLYHLENVELSYVIKDQWEYGKKQKGR